MALDGLDELHQPHLLAVDAIGNARGFGRVDFKRTIESKLADWVYEG